MDKLRALVLEEYRFDLLGRTKLRTDADSFKMILQFTNIRTTQIHPLLKVVNPTGERFFYSEISTSKQFNQRKTSEFMLQSYRARRDLGWHPPLESLRFLIGAQRLEMIQYSKYLSQLAFVFSRMHFSPPIGTYKYKLDYSVQVPAHLHTIKFGLSIYPEGQVTTLSKILLEDGQGHNIGKMLSGNPTNKEMMLILGQERIVSVRVKVDSYRCVSAQFMLFDVCKRHLPERVLAMFMEQLEGADIWIRKII